MRWMANLGRGHSARHPRRVKQSNTMQDIYGNTSKYLSRFRYYFHAKRKIVKEVCVGTDLNSMVTLVRENLDLQMFTFKVDIKSHFKVDFFDRIWVWEKLEDKWTTQPP